MQEPLFLVEALYDRSGIIGGATLPWCEHERLKRIRGREHNLFGQEYTELSIDGTICLGTLTIKNGQTSPNIEGLRNIRVIYNPSGNPVTLEKSGKVIHLPIESANKIIWLRNMYEGPDNLYLYHDRSFTVEPKNAVLLADEVVLNGIEKRDKKVHRPYVIHPLPETHKTPEGLQACEKCMKAMGNPSLEKLKDCIVFPRSI
jgi:hypothetical protein